LFWGLTVKPDSTYRGCARRKSKLLKKQENKKPLFWKNSKKKKTKEYTLVAKKKVASQWRLCTSGIAKHLGKNAKQKSNH